MSSDGRVVLAAILYGRVVKETVGVEDKWGERCLRKAVESTVLELEAEVGKVGEEVEKVVTVEEEKSERKEERTWTRPICEEVRSTRKMTWITDCSWLTRRSC